MKEIKIHEVWQKEKDSWKDCQKNRLIGMRLKKKRKVSFGK